MCAAPLRISRVSSFQRVSPSSFLCTTSRALSLSRTHTTHTTLALRFSLSCSSSFPFSLFPLLFPFPFPSSPPPAPCSYKHSARFAFRHNRDGNGSRVGDGSNRGPSSKRRAAGRSSRTSELETLLFTASDRLRAIKDFSPFIPPAFPFLSLKFSLVLHSPTRRTETAITGGLSRTPEAGIFSRDLTRTAYRDKHSFTVPCHPLRSEPLDWSLRASSKGRLGLGLGKHSAQLVSSRPKAQAAFSPGPGTIFPQNSIRSSSFSTFPEHRNILSELFYLSV